MLTKIHFIRHGKTDNPHNIVKGILNSFQLTTCGKNEVKKIGKYLSNKPINYIFHSPVKRTEQTAKIIHSFFPEAKLKSDKRLIEWQTDWQGYKITDIKKMPEMQWEIYKKDPVKFTKGVKAAQIARQMHGFVKEILKKYPGQEIIAVSHGDPIKLLRCLLETGKISSHFHRYKTTQPSINTMIFNDKHFKKTIYKSFIKNQSHLLE